MLYRATLAPLCLIKIQEVQNFLQHRPRVALNHQLWKTRSVLGGWGVSDLQPLNPLNLHYSVMTLKCPCSAVQCSAVYCSAVQCSARLGSAVQFSGQQCIVMQHSTVQCSATQLTAVRGSAVQCNVVQFIACSAVYWICCAVQHITVHVLCRCYAVCRAKQFSTVQYCSVLCYAWSSCLPSKLPLVDYLNLPSCSFFSSFEPFCLPLKMKPCCTESI